MDSTGAFAITQTVLYRMHSPLYIGMRALFALLNVRWRYVFESMVVIFYPFVTIALSTAFWKVGLENRTVYPKRIGTGDDGQFTWLGEQLMNKLVCSLKLLSLTPSVVSRHYLRMCAKTIPSDRG